MNELKKLIFCITLCLNSVAAFADTNTVNFLLAEFHRSTDADTRTEIVRTLGSYITRSEVQNTLRDIVSDLRSSPKSRAQAAFAISTLTTDQNFLNAIINAHDRSRNVWLRSKFLESIYPAAANNQKVLSVLKNNLVQNHDSLIHRASAFSLAKNIQNPQVKTFLIERCESPFLSESVKVEIVKGFYTVISDPLIKSTLNKIATSPLYSEELRSAATRVLATAPKTRSSRQTLFDLLSRSSSQQIRKQAAAGLKFELTEEDVQWMRLSVDPRSGLQRSPFTRL